MEFSTGIAAVAFAAQHILQARGATPAMRELKKYPNHQLYDLTESHYVMVEDVRKTIISGYSIHVVDSKDGSDITRSILLQILTEQGAEGHEPALTNRAIEQIIRFYGENFGSMVSWRSRNVRMLCSI